MDNFIFGGVAAGGAILIVNPIGKLFEMAT